MTQPVIPTAKQLLVCDEVVADASTGKVTVVNVWNAVRIPADATVPFTLARLCVFVCWRDGLGQVRTRIDVVQASTSLLVARTEDHILSFPRRMLTLYARYKREGCTFPEAGSYVVELYCENQFVDDQLIQVIEG